MTIPEIDRPPDLHERLAQTACLFPRQYATTESTARSSCTTRGVTPAVTVSGHMQIFRATLASVPRGDRTVNVG